MKFLSLCAAVLAPGLLLALPTADAAPAPAATVFYDMPDGSFVAIGGDDLGGLPFVLNDGPGPVRVIAFDASGGVVSSFGLFAGAGRSVAVPTDGDLEIRDVVDGLALGSCGRVDP